LSRFEDLGSHSHGKSEAALIASAHGIAWRNPAIARQTSHRFIQALFPPDANHLSYWHFSTCYFYQFLTRGAPDYLCPAMDESRTRNSDTGPAFKVEVRRMQTLIEGAFWVVGIILLAFYLGFRVQGAMFSRLAVRSFEDSVHYTPISTNEHRDQLLGINIGPWSQQRIEAYKQSLSRHFPPPLAILRVARIDLEVPVLDGTDSLTLNRGAGWIRGTTRPEQWGNIGIAGHRDGFFRRLKDVNVGDTLALATSTRTDMFVVDKIRVVNPDDVTVLRPGRPALTLVTCYPIYFAGSAPQRYIVHAALTHSVSLNMDSLERPAIRRNQK
jgi:sortase A